MDKTAFLEMFPCCAALGGVAGGLDKAYVTEAALRRGSMTLRVAAHFAARPAPADISALEGAIAADFGLAGVSIEADFPREERAPAPAAGGKKSAQVLFGKAVKGAVTPMDALTSDLSRVNVEGRVFAVDSREIQRLGAHVLQFDMTDGTGSVRVSKFFSREDDSSVIDKVKPGMYLLVSGAMKFNSYDKELELEPRHIQTVQSRRKDENRLPLFLGDGRELLLSEFALDKHGHNVGHEQVRAFEQFLVGALRKIVHHFVSGSYPAARKNRHYELVHFRDRPVRRFFSEAAERLFLRFSDRPHKHDKHRYNRRDYHCGSDKRQDCGDGENVAEEDVVAEIIAAARESPEDPDRVFDSMSETCRAIVRTPQRLRNMAHLKDEAIRELVGGKFGREKT